MNGYTFLICMSILYQILRVSQAQVIPYGDPCTPSGDKCAGDNTECSGGTCQCVSGFYWSGSACVSKVGLGYSCTSDIACKTTNAVCTGGKCTCNSQHFDDNGSTNGGFCRAKVELGSVGCSFNVSDSCKSPNAQCQSHGGYCTCNNGYYDSNGGGTGGGTCTQKVELGSIGCSTSVSDSCKSTNGKCQTNGYCTCNSGYYDSNGGADGGTCTQKVDLGGTGCSKSVTDSCKDGNAECRVSDQTCTCKTGYYDDNGSTLRGTCRKRKNLGAQCSTSQPVNKDQCKDSNARCTFSGSYYSCSCNDRYHQEGSVCVPDKAIGELCNNANECSDPNAGCLGSKCTCDQQHYQYKPSGGAKDVCEKVEQLQATGISFSNIQTTQFTVSWAPPAGKESYISGFSVEWRPTDNSESGDTRNVSSASPQTLTGLTPGRTYEVKVISKNTATQPGSIRSTSSKKNQAAEPSKPGTVTSTLNDLDARDNSITVRWGTSVGVATQYRVKLIDDSTEVTSKTSTSRTAVISHSKLKDGYIYTVHIEARSQAFDGSYLWSEKRISTIKTKVQVPDPPRNGVCKDPTDKSITLEWSEPADTKGDLVKYHIRVYHYYNTTKYIVSTKGTQTQKTVGNLDPGTWTFVVL